MAVRDGRIVLPDGMSYRLLVLPERKAMPVEVVEKIRDLVAAGATVVGTKTGKRPRPEGLSHSATRKSSGWPTNCGALATARTSPSIVSERDA